MADQPREENAKSKQQKERDARASQPSPLDQLRILRAEVAAIKSELRRVTGRNGIKVAWPVISLTNPPAQKETFIGIVIEDGFAMEAELNGTILGPA